MASLVEIAKRASAMETVVGRLAFPRSGAESGLTKKEDLLMFMGFRGIGRMVQIVRWMVMLAESIFLLFLPVWCFLVVETFTPPGNPFHNYFVLGSGKTFLALAQMMLIIVLLGFFVGELEMRWGKRQT